MFHEIQPNRLFPPRKCEIPARLNMRSTGNAGRAPFEANMLELNRGHPSLDGRLNVVAANEPSIAESFTYALGVVRRQVFVVLLFAMLGTGLSLLIYLKAAPPYAATATLLVDTHKIDILQQSAVSSEMPIGAMGAMESQIELLKSDQVALSVIKKLRLWEDPRFVGDEKPGVVSRLAYQYFPWLSPERSLPSDANRLKQALRVFKKSLTVDRVGLAYALEIGFESRDPDLAAQVANEVADAYNDLQRMSSSDAARQASDWLEARMPELRAKSEAAQQAVVEYKTEQNIVETGGGLIKDQLVADVNAKLNAARDETSKAKARFDQLAAIGGTADAGAVGKASISNDSQNDILSQLRSQYFDVSSKEADLSTKLGLNNPIIVSLRNQKAQLRSEILEEIQRVKQSSKSDYEAAQLRQDELKKEFEAAVFQSQTAKQAQVKLQELESSARAYQDLYNTFLVRYNASLQQAVSPVVGAIVITPAAPPVERDYKKTFKVAALFPIAGLALGLGVALMRELLAGRVFRTSKSIQSRLGIACVGVLPRVEGARRPRRLRHAQTDIAPRALARGDRGISWTVVDHPLSRFSEGVRSIKMAIDMDNRSRSGKVVGFTSAIPNEGKSTVALAVGQLIARNGASVVLVDCDLRNPSLTRSVAPDAASGIAELTAGEASLSDVVWTDQSTQMAFLPAIPRSGPPDPPTILASVELKRIFDQLRTLYEFVIVDLSPIAPVVDVCATSELIDSYVLVIEYGRTTIDVVEHALRAAPDISKSMVGAVLNKANIRDLSKYDPYLSGYYYTNQSNRSELTDI
jgi:polysaccharide biosynthesis transport protein